MKYNLKDIEFDKFELNNPPAGFNSFNEKQDLTYFIYQNPDPILVKVVLHWEIMIKLNPELKIQIMDLVAEQTAIIILDGGLDKKIIANMIGSSHLQLQLEFTEKASNPNWKRYQFLGFDYPATAEKLYNDLLTGE